MIPIEQTPDDPHNPDMPSNRVRELIFSRIRTDSEFEAFCSDYFPQTACLFTSGMDRQARITLLFQREGASAVLVKLREKFPSPGTLNSSASTPLATPKHTDKPGVFLYRYRRSAIALAPVTGLALGLCLLYQFLVHVTPFGPHQHGIVLYKPLLASPTTLRLASRLCEALQLAEKAPVRCESTFSTLSQSARVKNAAKAGAVIAAVLDADQMLSVSVLIDEHQLPLLPVHELPPLPVAEPAEAQSAAHALNLLRRYLSGREEDCRAPFELKGIEPHYALIGILLRFRCQGGRSLEGDGDSNEYQRAVMEISRTLCVMADPGNLPCRLSQYFLALNCPEDKEASACQQEGEGLLRHLVNTSDDPLLGQLARIELSRRICESSPSETLALLDTVLSRISQADSCKRASLAPMLFCARLGLSDDDRRNATLTMQQQQINSSLSQCPKAASLALAEIGSLQLRRGLWDSAAKTLARAHAISASSRTALALAEAELLLGRTKQVAKLLSVSHTEPTLATHAAFVRWLADPSPETLNELKAQYRQVPWNQRAVFDATRTLNELACVQAGSTSIQCQVLRLLSNRKLEENRQNHLDRLVEKSHDR